MFNDCQHTAIHSYLIVFSIVSKVGNKFFMHVYIQRFLIEKKHYVNTFKRKSHIIHRYYIKYYT